MANNGSTVSIAQPSLPIFKGDNYDYWSIKMKTLFKSQELWDLVENGYNDQDEETRLRENRKKDSKALFFIQQAVHESFFPKISAATTAKEAWTTLQQAFHGSSTVVTVKLQTLNREFQNLQMKNGESVQDFLTKVAEIVNQMRSYGEEVSERTVVTKVLRSLPQKFDHVVAAIEESKNLSTYSFDELMGSSQSHEARLNRLEDKNEEKAFQVKGEGSMSKERENATGRGRGRGGFRGKNSSHDKGRGRGPEQRFNNKGSIQCYNCKKFGHVKAECWNRGKQANYAEEVDEESKLFMAHEDTIDMHGEVWFVDSGCSNHMTG